MKENISKALIIGSGGIKIAEAAEFDYSGSQALKALREEGIKTIIVNPNVATIQTSYRLADKVYLVPLSEYFLEKIIEIERPDGILVGFGGQSALSLGVSLHKKGILQRYGVKVLGTPIEGIERALERGLFRETMTKVGIPIPPSRAVYNLKDALEAAEEIGYPVMVRVSFNLGGRGTFVAYTKKELMERFSRAMAHSPVKGLLVEKYLKGWKEIEYEIMRDRCDNSAAIACLENIDPMGIHTGDSIVVAPSQTLTDREYQTLRDASIGVARAIGLVGECNVQLALNPRGEDFYVIETNPRMSRSSALASKATGYPLAYIAAKLALGYLLDELINKVTGVTTAFFEPSLDYVVVKVPRWDLQKFMPMEETIGSEMKSVGEVMAIGRSLEEALQKAFRMLDIGVPGIVGGDDYFLDEDLEDVLKRLDTPRPYWPLDAAKAIRLGADVDEIVRRTNVDRFYIVAIRNIVTVGEALRILKNLPLEQQVALLREATKLGFNEDQISRFSSIPRDEVRRMMNIYGVKPCVKNIDTLAGEYPSMTNYLYLTYNGFEDEITEPKKTRVCVVGAGVFRIGVSVEFDWAVVGLADALRKNDVEAVIINYNPETVSTDWDVVDRLYFEEIEPSTLHNIYEKEKAYGIITSAGGQLGNNVTVELVRRGLRLLGTQSENVDRAENRSKFSKLIEELGFKQPKWIEAKSIEEVLEFADDVGYPVIVRPSYVLSGSAMAVAYDSDELKKYLIKATKVSPKYPVVVSKFIDGAIEAELDCVTDSESVFAIPLEHIEPAGVHSGDSTIYTPTRYMVGDIRRKALNIASTLSEVLKIKGPFNVQLLIKDSEVYIVELNLRFSRSMPFSSKACGVMLTDLTADVLMKSKLPILPSFLSELDNVYTPRMVAWSVKSPQFSWAQLKGCYPFLGPEMRSTGEVASHGRTFEEALLKSWLSAQPNRIPKENEYVLIYPTSQRHLDILALAADELLRSGYEVLTFDKMPIDGLKVLDEDTLLSMIKDGKLTMLITSGYRPDLDYKLRRAAADHNVSLILDANLALELSRAIRMMKTGMVSLEVSELKQYWYTFWNGSSY